MLRDCCCLCLTVHRCFKSYKRIRQNGQQFWISCIPTPRIVGAHVIKLNFDGSSISSSWLHNNKMHMCVCVVCMVVLLFTFYWSILTLFNYVFTRQVNTTYRNKDTENKFKFLMSLKNLQNSKRYLIQNIQDVRWVAIY